MRLLKANRLLVLAALLLPLAAPAQLPLPGTASPAPSGPESRETKAGLQFNPEEIRKRLAEARDALARIEAPGGLAAGAPPGTPEGELINRRFLLRQLVRAYEGRLSEMAGAANAEQRRADIQARHK
ncbi:MAG TPA: hypothetical protein VFP70_01025, partial [Burkholderiales bacterium]|nr:hypothetical protein [Burkholderiales bacterium]